MGPTDHAPQAQAGCILSPEETSICSLGSQCTQVATDLIGMLGTLKVDGKDGGALRQVEGLYRALVRAWKQEEVERLGKRLDRISAGIQRELATYDRREILRRLDELEVSGCRPQLEALRQDFSKGLEMMSDQLQKQELQESTMELLHSSATQGVRYSAEHFILESMRRARRVLPARLVGRAA